MTSSIQSINPATEEVLRTFEPHTFADAAVALDAACTAFTAWRRTSFEIPRPLQLNATNRS